MTRVRFHKLASPRRWKDNEIFAVILGVVLTTLIGTPIGILWSRYLDRSDKEEIPVMAAEVKSKILIMDYEQRIEIIERVESAWASWDSATRKLLDTSAEPELFEPKLSRGEALRNWVDARADWETQSTVAYGAIQQQFGDSSQQERLAIQLFDSLLGISRSLDEAMEEYRAQLPAAGGRPARLDRSACGGGTADIERRWCVAYDRWSSAHGLFPRWTDTARRAAKVRLS